MSRQHTPPEIASSHLFPAQPPQQPSRALLWLLLPGLPLAFCLGYVWAGLGAANDNVARAGAATSLAITTAPTSPDPINPASTESAASLSGLQPAAAAQPRRASHIADRFRDADRDGDGTLSRSEARALRGVWQKFELIDANQDGRISRAELAQYRQQSKRRHRAGTQSPAAVTLLSEQPAEQGRRR